MAAFVYILRCRDGSYYTGCTTKLDLRIAQHKAGTYAGYTAARLPVECVWNAEFQNIYDAIDFERRLKRWSRVKKEAVIRGEWDHLPELSRSYQHHGRREGASFDTDASRPAQDDDLG